MIRRYFEYMRLDEGSTPSASTSNLKKVPFKKCEQLVTALWGRLVLTAQGSIKEDCFNITPKVISLFNAPLRAIA